MKYNRSNSYILLTIAGYHTYCMASLPVLRYYVLHLVPSRLFGTLHNIYAQVRGYIPVCTLPPEEVDTWRGSLIFIS